MEIRKNIAGIPVEKLKKLAIKYLGNDSFESQQKIALKINVAKCARLSYMTFDNNIDYDKDIKLHDRLLKDGHMSPFEHCAKVMNDEEYAEFIKGRIVCENIDGEIEVGLVAEYSDQIFPKKHHGWCNNFRGFISYRYLIENDVF